MAKVKPVVVLIRVWDAKFEKTDNYNINDLEVVAKLTSGESGSIKIGQDVERTAFPIINNFGVLRFTLNQKIDNHFIGSVSFSAGVFSPRMGNQYRHWVSLNDSSYNDDFLDELGDNQSELPKILLDYSIEELVETERDSSIINITEEVHSPEKFEDLEPEPEEFPVGDLVPGSVFTTGNLRVSLERRRLNPNKYRGEKGKEETVAVLSQASQAGLEKYMEQKTVELIEEVNMEKQTLNQDEERHISRLKELEKNQNSLADDELDLKRICEKAILSLEETKREVQNVKDEENEERRKIMEEIKKLEMELDGVDQDLNDAEHEYEEINLTIKKQKVKN